MNPLWLVRIDVSAISGDVKAMDAWTAEAFYLDHGRCIEWRGVQPDGFEHWAIFCPIAPQAELVANAAIGKEWQERGVKFHDVEPIETKS